LHRFPPVHVVGRMHMFFHHVSLQIQHNPGLPNLRPGWCKYIWNIQETFWWTYRKSLQAQDKYHG
jgi:hypothetical protein